MSKRCLSELFTKSAKPARRGFGPARQKTLVVALGVVAFYLVAGYLMHFDLGKVVTGLPKIGRWLATAWPPAFSEMPLFLWRTAETIAMAAVGTTLAVLIGISLSILASRNITPCPALYQPTRWVLNALRDTAALRTSATVYYADAIGSRAGGKLMANTLFGIRLAATL